MVSVIYKTMTANTLYTLLCFLIACIEITFSILLKSLQSFLQASFYAPSSRGVLLKFAWLCLRFSSLKCLWDFFKCSIPSNLPYYFLKRP